MTAQWAPGALPAALPARRWRPGWFFWAFLALQALFLLWIIGTSVVLADTYSEAVRDCTTAGADLELCEASADVGSMLAVSFVVFLWAATDIVLGGSYALYRLAKRH